MSAGEGIPIPRWLGWVIALTLFFGLLAWQVVTFWPTISRELGL